MAEADALHGVIEKFVAPDINLSPHDAIGPDGRKLPGLTNLGMGYVFEELIRKFNEENNEEAGEHFTPREVIQLMVHLLFEPVKKQLPPVITIYDPACGSGGMLTEAQDFIRDPDGAIQSSAAIYLYGKEVNPETYAICKSDMMIKSQVFDNREFGYWKVTVERPLRKSAQFSAERIAPLRFDKSLATEMEGIHSQWGEAIYEKGFLAGKKEAIQRWLDSEQIELKGAVLKKLLDPKLWLARRELLEMAEKLLAHFGDKEWNDFAACTEETKAALKKLKLKPGAPQIKQILDAVSWRDPEAAPLVVSQAELSITRDFDFEAARTWVSEIEDGTGTLYEADSELRDTENVPLTYEGGIAAYFQKEVLPHVPDAWIDKTKTVVGYEISFNKYFYVHQPLRDLAEVVQEIRALEAETEGLLEQILDFSSTGH